MAILISLIDRFKTVLRAKIKKTSYNWISKIIFNIRIDKNYHFLFKIARRIQIFKPLHQILLCFKVMAILISLLDRYKTFFRPKIQKNI